MMSKFASAQVAAFHMLRGVHEGNELALEECRLLSHEGGTPCIAC